MFVWNNSYSFNWLETEENFEDIKKNGFSRGNRELGKIATANPDFVGFFRYIQNDKLTNSGVFLCGGKDYNIGEKTFVKLVQNGKTVSQLGKYLKNKPDTKFWNAWHTTPFRIFCIMFVFISFGLTYLLTIPQKPLQKEYLQISPKLEQGFYYQIDQEKIESLDFVLDGSQMKYKINFEGKIIVALTDNKSKNDDYVDLLAKEFDLPTATGKFDDGGTAQIINFTAMPDDYKWQGMYEYSSINPEKQISNQQKTLDNAKTGTLFSLGINVLIACIFGYYGFVGARKNEQGERDLQEIIRQLI